MQTNIPKSLHTVTVIVAVARTMKGAPRQNMADCALAVSYALDVLGYSDTPDTYGLADKAAAILAREVQS